MTSKSSKGQRLVEIGEIEKTPVSRGGRKLLLITLVFRGTDSPQDYVEKFDLYWQQVGEHISNLEAKLGKLSRLYHELISLADEEGLKVLEKLNPSSWQLIKARCENGAKFEATEDKDLVEESIDWERCLLAGLLSSKVAQMVSEFYMEAFRKRHQHIARRIDETLKEGEVAALIIGERHAVQFPGDIDVFSVAPPALDQIHKWLRDYNPAKEK